MTRTRIISDMIADGTVLTVDLSDASVTSPKISFPVRAPDGAAATPSYSFINATGAGLRWDAVSSWFNIENPTGRLVLAAKLDPVLVSNGYDFDGTNWRSYDTAVASATTTMSGSGGFAWYIAPATTGNLAWASRMSLDASGNLSIGGTSLTVAGTQVSLNTHNHDAAYVNTTGDTMSGKLYIGLATGGIGTATASEGQLELQNAGSGACKITFHRTGSFAAYFGVDTDNLWKVGGWSMGAAAYRVMLGDGFSNGGALTVGGRITGNTDAVFPSVYATNHYVGMSGSYYIALSGANYMRSVGMHIMSDGQFCFNANTGINWSWDGTYITSTHSIRSGGTVYMNGNTIYFANNGGIYITWDGTNLSFTHRVNAPNYTVGNGGSYQMIDTNVRIARPAGTNIMYIYAYDAQWAFIRTPDSTNVGYVDNGGFHSISKLKHKTNITPIRDGLARVCDERVTPISYAVKGYDTSDTPSLGFSAEDMAEVVPNAVGYDEEGPASINYGSLVAVLWDAVRTLNTRIEELEKAA